MITTVKLYNNEKLVTKEIHKGDPFNIALNTGRHYEDLGFVVTYSYHPNNLFKILLEGIGTHIIIQGK